MSERFVSERIKPISDTCDTGKMSYGMPGLPGEFVWRKEKVLVAQTLRTWRTTGACRHGSGEQYARRQWFEVATAQHGVMKIYFNRSMPGRTREMGWWLYSVKGEEVGEKILGHIELKVDTLPKLR